MPTATGRVKPANIMPCLDGTYLLYKLASRVYKRAFTNNITIP